MFYWGLGTVEFIFKPLNILDMFVTLFPTSLLALLAANCFWYSAPFTDGVLVLVPPRFRFIVHFIVRFIVRLTIFIILDHIL